VSTIPKTSFGQISFRTIVEGVGPQDATSQMRKDEDLPGMIRFTRCVYA